METDAPRKSRKQGEGGDIIISRIIERREIKPILQPIISLTDYRVYGYEALARGPDDLPNPAELFSRAKKENMTRELDVICIETAFQSIKEQLNSWLLFVNVYPSTLSWLTKEKKRLEALKKLFPPEKVVFEVIEIENMNERLTPVVAANNDLNPNYIKVDRSLVSRCHEKSNYKKTLKIINELATSIGAKVVAEGIETEDELLFLQSINIPLGQGFLFIDFPGNNQEAKAPNLKKQMEECTDGRNI